MYISIGRRSGWSFWAISRLLYPVGAFSFLELRSLYMQGGFDCIWTRIVRSRLVEKQQVANSAFYCGAMCFDCCIISVPTSKYRSRRVGTTRWTGIFTELNTPQVFAYKASHHLASHMCFWLLYRSLIVKEGLSLAMELIQSGLSDHLSWSISPYLCFSAQV